MKALSFGRRWVMPLSAVCLAACAGFVGMIASEQDAIKAPHARHAQAEVDCGTCHESIFESTNLETKDLPTEKKCLGCHKEDKKKGNCVLCHTKPDKPQLYATHVRELKMNHAEHIERVKEDCTVCHKTLPEPLRTEGMAPKMDTCLTCHEHQAQFDSGNCGVCHRDLSKYPLRPISAFSHQVDYLENHRLDARSQGAMCSTCHEQSFCTGCHAKTEAVRIDVRMAERVDRQFIHRNDFFSRHPVEAKADPALCLRCHGVDFCQSCHARNGLNVGDPDTLKPHPPGFGDGALHGPAARRDIVSCASCHDQGAASNCVSCHKTGGIGGNPHPPSWLVRHRTEEIGRNVMCQTCHL